MGIFDLVVEGLVEDVDVWEGPSEEDMKKNRRPQAPKSRSLVALAAIQSTGAGTHKSKKDYQRKPKHFKGWD